VPYRSLSRDKQFSKYQWIDVDLKRATSDARPESYNLNIETIKLGPKVPTTNEWAARRHILRPLMRPSMCAIRKVRDEQKAPTLGLFRPKTINRLLIEPSEPDWSPEQKAILNQQSLGFEATPRRELEKIPFNFFYEFVCDDTSCKGHKMSCTDWEMSEAYRKWRKEYGANWEQPFRQRFEREMIERCDTHFYVGTMHQHPGTWIIVGLFYPPKRTMADLFD
jgi:hypothetical protein